MSAATVAAWAVTVAATLTVDCCCEQTGNLNSPQDPQVSIGPGFREAVYHVVVGGQTSARMEEVYYPLGESSYLSESAYDMGGQPNAFRQRYWGAENYERLAEIKSSVDPSGVFWCHHCVGDADGEA